MGYSVDFGQKEKKNSENESSVDFYPQQIITFDHESQTPLLSSEVCTNKNSITDSLSQSIFDADTQVIIKESEAQKESNNLKYKGINNLENNHTSISSSRLSHSNPKNPINSEHDSIYIADTQVIFQQKDTKMHNVDFGQKEKKNS